MMNKGIAPLLIGIVAIAVLWGGYHFGYAADSATVSIEDTATGEITTNTVSYGIYGSASPKIKTANCVAIVGGGDKNNVAVTVKDANTESTKKVPVTTSNTPQPSITSNHCKVIVKCPTCAASIR